MTCENPRVVWVRRHYPIGLTDEQITEYNKPKMQYRKGYMAVEVPCGKCLGCRLDHANEWATRCYCELKEWGTGCFITLTYNNPHLPLTKKGIPTLNKKHIVQFMKNLRKHEKGEKYWTNPNTGKYEAPIRFMVAGEYGDKNQRPHYHLCIFNWKPDDLKYEKTEDGNILYTSKKVDKYWENKQQKEGHKSRGFSIIGELTYKSACYVARYCQKKAGIESKPRRWKWIEEVNKKTGEIKQVKKIVKENKIREDEFINSSRNPGIGRNYWERHKEEIKKNNGIWVNDGKAKLKRIPRYFRKRWNEENWLEFETWKYNQSKKAEKTIRNIVKQFDAPKMKTDWQKLKAIRECQAKILKDKTNLLKRNKFE